MVCWRELCWSLICGPAALPCPCMRNGACTGVAAKGWTLPNKVFTPGTEMCSASDGNRIYGSFSGPFKQINVLVFFQVWPLCLMVKVMCPYWFLSNRLRFLCWRGILWITMRSFRLFWVEEAPAGTLPAWGRVQRQMDGRRKNRQDRNRIRGGKKTE